MVAATPSDSNRLAIVHEKFTVYGGSEKCVEQMHLLWPDAPIFTTVLDPESTGPLLADADIRPSSIVQRFFRGGDSYAHLLPLFPIAMAHHDLSDFDVVVTSHHAFANRARTSSNTKVVSYVHSPARWMWDQAMIDNEVGGRIGRAGLRAFAATQRSADRRAATRPNVLLANSTEVASRIERWWDRNAAVVAPPVDTDFFMPDTSQREDFFLLAGRLVPYKRPDIAIAAADRAGVRLVVAGEGRWRRHCEQIAGPRTEFLGWVDRETQRDLFRRCRALVFPGVEDFGIVPVEAQACGAPVIALDAGGSRDTVAHGISGIRYAGGNDHFAELAERLVNFEANAFDSARIREHAVGFDTSVFREKIVEFVDKGLASE